MTPSNIYSLPLKTDRLVLRDFTSADQENWLTLRNLPETRKYNQYTELFTPEQGDKIVGKFASQSEQSPRLKYTLAITLPDTGEFIGYVSLLVYDEVDEGLSEISYSLYPPHWSQGYTTEAVEAMVQFAFEGLKLHRVEAGCSAENAASYRVLEKAGFTREGRIRQDMQVEKGIWQDELIYGILETDPFEAVLR